MNPRGLFEKLIELVYPSRAVCLGCGSAAGFDEPWLCGACRATLAQRWVGAFPDKKLDGCAAAYLYAGLAGGVVRSLKFRGVRAVAPVMAEDMCRACDALEPLRADLVTAVPMHEKRLRRRGFNHAELLAREVADRRGIPYADVVRRVRDTPQQAKLTEDQRRSNLKGAFEAAGPLEGRRVLLVDDVYTTGETARRCANALYRAGATDVYFLSYAKG